MNERTHFFIKISLLHFILERVDVGCMWEVSWRRGQTATYRPSSSDHSSSSFSSWLGLLHLGSLRVQSPLSAVGSHFGILSPTDSSRLQLTRTASGTLLYNCLSSTCFCCSSAYLHKCISWLTVEGQYVTIIQFLFFKIPRVEFFFSCPSPSPSHTFYK